jgi:hypothetical protein
MDRGTYHRARGLFGFGYRAINHRSGRPEGAKGDSPGQSEAPPWVHCALVSIAVGDYAGFPVLAEAGVCLGSPARGIRHLKVNPM